MLINSHLAAAPSVPRRLAIANRTRCLYGVPGGTARAVANNGRRRSMPGVLDLLPGRSI
jgi:hypothetical protein